MECTYTDIKIYKLYIYINIYEYKLFNKYI